MVFILVAIVLGLGRYLQCHLGRFLELIGIESVVGTFTGDDHVDGKS